MNTSDYNKSKILKLINKQNKLKLWNNIGDLILLLNAITSSVPFAIFTILNISIWLTLFGALYLVSSMSAICINNLLKNKTLLKISDIDQQILNIVKSDDDEMVILKEYYKVQDIQKNLNKEKRLLKELIDKNYNKNNSNKISKYAVKQEILNEFSEDENLIIK